MTQSAQVINSAESAAHDAADVPDGQSKSAQAFGLALLLEVAIIVGVVLILANSTPTQAAHDEPVPLTLVDDPEPKKEEPKPEPQPKPQPVKLVSKVVPKMPTPPQPQIVEPTPPLAAVESDVQTAFANPAPPPPPAPAPSAGKVDKSQEYAGKVHDAVQSAYFYPPVAAAMHFSGRVRVEFVLKDAHVVESHILQSCGIGIFDRAALEAVQKAHYPEAPENLRGQDLHYQIWVELSTR